MVPNCTLLHSGQIVLVPNCPMCQIVLGAILSSFQYLPNCPLFIMVPNCPRCQIVLFYIAVPNCPGVKMFQVPQCPGANLSSFTLECQIVLVPKCHRCQIVIVQITCLRPKVKIWSGPLKGLFLSHGISLVFENKSFGTFGNQVWWFGQASPSNSSPWKFILEISAGSY